MVGTFLAGKFGLGKPQIIVHQPRYLAKSLSRKEVTVWGIFGI